MPAAVLGTVQGLSLTEPEFLSQGERVCVHSAPVQSSEYGSKQDCMRPNISHCRVSSFFNVSEGELLDLATPVVTECNDNRINRLNSVH